MSLLTEVSLELEPGWSAGLCSVGLSVAEVTIPAVEGRDKPRETIPTLVCLASSVEEDEVGVRFFGLGNLLGGGASNNCGCNCGYPSNNYPSNNYPSNNYPSNNYPSNSGSYQQNCQCNNQLTFQDKYGNTHGACRRPDETGKRWCYTTGTYPGCSDASQSQRYPNNPWSYQACSYSG